MSASKRCSECQAVNTATAQWCAQCFVPFGSVTGPQGGAASGATATREALPPAPSPQPAGPLGTETGTPEPSPAASPRPATASVSDSEEMSPDQISALLSARRLDQPDEIPAESLPDDSDADGATWTCKTCEATNPLSVDVCHVCGVSIFDGFAGTEDDVPKLSLADATILAILPGAGHMKQGHGLLGLIILMAVATLWIFGVWLGVSDSAATGVLFVLVALTLLGISVVDSRTIASGGTRLLLTPRVLSLVFGAAIVGIMAVVWLRAIS